MARSNDDFTHFHVHGTPRFKTRLPGTSRKQWCHYTLDYKYRLSTKVFALRADRVVTCPRCMVIKDMWLTAGKLKPLTMRRLGALLRLTRNS